MSAPVAVFRSSSDRVAAAVFALGAVLGLVIVALNRDLEAYVVGPVDLAVFSLASYRSLRARITAGQTGLVAQQTARLATTLDWAEVDRFAYRGSLRGLGAWLQGGRWVTLQNYGAVHKAQATEVVIQLGTLQSAALRRDAL